MRIVAIVAMDEGRLIGRDNQLPWRLPEDMKRFAGLTTGHTVLMGRKTWDSLPPKFRPLPNRKNIVVSRTVEALEGAEVWSSIGSCLEAYRAGEAVLQGDTLWIIGGASIYRAALPYFDAIELTLVEGRREGDAYFPDFEEHFDVVKEDRRQGYSFLTYERRCGANSARRPG